MVGRGVEKAEDVIVEVGAANRWGGIKLSVEAYRCGGTNVAVDVSVANPCGVILPLTVQGIGVGVTWPIMVHFGSVCGVNCGANCGGPLFRTTVAPCPKLSSI